MPDLNTTDGTQAAQQMTAAAQTPPNSSVAPPAPPTPPAAATAPSQTPAPPQSAAPAQPTPNQVAQHHQSLLGRAAQFLFGAPQNYQVDPATGKMTATPMEQSPGALFRSILGGAILGGAIGSQNKTGSGLQAAAQGAAGVLKNNQQQDLNQRAQAQQDFQNQQAIDRAKEQQTFQAAQIAHMHNADLVANANLDFAARDHIDDLNKMYQGRTDALVQAGGKPAPIMVNGQDVNGKQGNWSDISKAFIQNPATLQPPAGYHRIQSQTIDTSGLHYDPGKGWVDQDGKYVDISARTTHTFYDVPEGLMNKTVTPTGADLLKGSGGLLSGSDIDPKTTYPMPLGDYLSLTGKGAQNLHENASTAQEWAKTRVAATQAHTEAARLQHEITMDNRAQMQGAYQVAQNRVAGLNDQLKSLEAANPMDPQIPEIRNQISAASDSLEKIGESIYPVLQAGHPSPFLTPSFVGKKVPGMIAPGNVDLTNRPNIDNHDGTHSTTFSMSFDTDSGSVLVPGVGDGTTYPLRQLRAVYVSPSGERKWFVPGDQPKDWKQTRPTAATNEAFDQYQKTGNNFGTFKDYKAADAYGEILHNDQAHMQKPEPLQMYVDANGQQFRLPPSAIDGFLKTHPGAKPLAGPKAPTPDPGGPPNQTVVVQWPTGGTTTMTRQEYADQLTSQNVQTQNYIRGAKIVGPVPSSTPSAPQPKPDLAQMAPSLM